MEVRWYRKLDDSVVLQICINERWRDVEEISEYGERLHRRGKYHPTHPNQKRYEVE